MEDAARTTKNEDDVMSAAAPGNVHIVKKYSPELSPNPREELMEEGGDLRLRINAANMEIRSLVDKKNIMEKEIESLGTEKNAVEVELQRLGVTMNGMKGDIDTLNREICFFGTRRDSLVDKKNIMEKEIESLGTEKKNAIDVELQRPGGTMNGMKGDIDTLKREICSLGTRMDFLEQRKEALVQSVPQMASTTSSSEIKQLCSDRKTKNENKDEVMSTSTAAPANVNIDDTIYYYRKRIISKFESTYSLSIWYFVIYLIGMIFIMYKSWVRMIIISILVSLVFQFILWLIAQYTWEKLQPYLMITSGPRSMKEVSSGVSHLIPWSALSIIIHFFMVAVNLPPQVLDEAVLYGFLYLCAVLFVFPVLQFRNDSKMTDDLIAFERSVQQSSAAIDHPIAACCKCTMPPPSASASDSEWIRFYLVR